MTGYIKSLVDSHGFGFIRDANGTDTFFHKTALSADLDFYSLQPDQEVEFDVEASPKGPRCTSVRRVASTPTPAADPTA